MELGDLEAEVLGILVRFKKATTGQVMDNLDPPRRLSYSTINTTLDRLYKKKVLTRYKEPGERAPRYVYMIKSKEELECKVVRAFVDRLLTAFGPTVIVTLSDYLDQIPKAELKRLENEFRTN